jgi:hypothetical protein
VTFRFLVSFHYHKDSDLQAIVDAYGGPCEVFADSGAFSAATLGATIKRADYAAWLHQWRGVLTTSATLDVIGDPVATHRNTNALEDQGLTVLPVFHVGSPWERLHELCKEYRYIALGGMVPHAKKPDAVLRWLVQCFKIAREYGTVFHGFGQTRFATIAALPFYSVDSSAWGSGSRYGQISLWDERRAKLVTVQVSKPDQARKHAALLRSHGADPALVGRPGFAMIKQRTREQYDREDLMMRGAPAVAYHRLGQWLIRRHKVPAPPGWERPGTALYLADGAHSQLTKAAQILRDEENRGTHMYLAETAQVNLHKAAKVIAREDGGEGTQLYLAEANPKHLHKIAKAIAADTGVAARKDSTPS